MTPEKNGDRSIPYLTMKLLSSPSHSLSLGFLCSYSIALSLPLPFVVLLTHCKKHSLLLLRPLETKQQTTRKTTRVQKTPPRKTKVNQTNKQQSDQTSTSKWKKLRRDAVFRLLHYLGTPLLLSFPPCPSQCRATTNTPICFFQQQTRNKSDREIKRQKWMQPNREMDPFSTILRLPWSFLREHTWTWCLWIEGGGRGTEREEDTE